MIKFSRQKIGAKLLETTLQTAFNNAGLEQITLAVSEKNQNAQNLYKKFNFVEYGRLPNYFKDNEKYETQVFMNLARAK
jgi:ribosomal protein S18 acetylase RimI-like enzyme